MDILSQTYFKQTLEHSFFASIRLCRKHQLEMIHEWPQTVFAVSLHVFATVTATHRVLLALHTHK